MRRLGHNYAGIEMHVQQPLSCRQPAFIQPASVAKFVGNICQHPSQNLIASERQRTRRLR
jgi:hypothetical protein